MPYAHAHHDPGFAASAIAAGANTRAIFSRATIAYAKGPGI